MEAPDKIFVPVVYLGPEDGDCPSPIWWEKYKSHEHEEVIGSITYIRKDAMLEWLESGVYEHNEDRFDDGFNTALGQVIDKLNTF